MKVLWLTGALLPEATAALSGDSVQAWNATGSWILGSAAAITQMPDIQLYMAATSQQVKSLTRVETNGIISYAMPYGRGHFLPNRDYEVFVKTINDEVHPDVIHIHGTEFSTGLAWLKVCGPKHVVISIQGMTSVYADYYKAGLKFSDILYNITFRDLIRGGIWHEAAQFRKRGRFECNMIRNVRHVIGRTSWDRAHVWAINPEIAYHHNDETLRHEFYTAPHWSYETCCPHTIFFSQAWLPLKGLHQLIKALPLILREFPDTQIRVAGLDPTREYDLRQWWRVSGYGSYLWRLITRMNIRSHITFTGPLGTCDMIRELHNCNLFLLSSSIENSPNSLGEAQMLEVPVLASYVGGVMDMMDGHHENLYRFNDTEMLAEKVCQIFRQGPECSKAYADLAITAARRHDPMRNAAQLFEIYQTIKEE